MSRPPPDGLPDLLGQPADDLPPFSEELPLLPDELEELLPPFPDELPLDGCDDPPLDEDVFMLNS